jgi:flavin-dependent dehydrogenase
MEAIFLTLDRAKISTLIDIVWDAVIIGAGPAGAMAACSLSDRGLSVLLIDRQGFPRKKVCGGCLSASAIEILAQNGLSNCIESLEAQTIDQMDLRCGSARLKLDLPAGLAVSRAALDTALVKAAVQRGATFVDSISASLDSTSPGKTSPGNDAISDTRTVSLTAGGERLGTVEARVVIVASGLNRSCLVAPGGKEFAQRTMPRSRMGLGTMIAPAPPNTPDTPDTRNNDHLNNDYPAGQIHMAVGRGGYVGLARVEGGQLNIAAAMDAPYLKSCEDPAQAVGQLLDQCGYPKPQQLGAANWQGTSALTTRLIQPVGRRVFILGDAAGYIEPFTGEGMTWALATGAAIAPLVQRAQSSWNSSIEQDWLDLYRKLVGRRQRWCKQLAWLLRRPRLANFTLRAARPLSFMTRHIITRLHQPVYHTAKSPHTSPLPGAHPGTGEIL